MGCRRDADITSHMFLGGCHDFAIFLRKAMQQQNVANSEFEGPKKKTHNGREERTAVITSEAVVHQDKVQFNHFFTVEMVEWLLAHKSSSYCVKLYSIKDRDDTGIHIGCSYCICNWV